jgi:hypothetical protein
MSWGNFYPKRIVFTGAPICNNYRVCGLYSYNFLAETSSFILDLIILSCSVSEFGNLSHLDSTAAQFFQSFGRYDKTTVTLKPG